MAGRALSFLLLPLYTRYLSPADYGIIQLVELTFDVLTLVAGTRLAAGLFHFHEKADDAVAKNAVLSTTMITLAVAYSVVAILAFLFAAPISRIVFNDDTHGTLIRIAAGSFLFQGLTIVPLAELRRQGRAGMFVAVSSGKLAAQAAFNVFFLVVLELGVLSMFLSTLIVSAVLATWLSVHLLRGTGLAFSRGVLRQLLRFGIPLIATQVATIFTTFGDRFFLQRAAGNENPTVLLAGEAAVGIYALAYQFGFLLQSIGVDPFISVWAPVRFAIAKDSNRDAIYSRSFLLLNLLLITMAVGIALFVQDILWIIADPAYHSAAELVPIILVAYIFQGWSMTQDTGLMIREKTEYITVANWISAGVALLGYLILIPRFLGWGAAYASAIALGVRQVIIYRSAQRLWPIRYDWAPVVRLCALGVGAVLIKLLLPIEERVLSIAISFLLFAAYIAGLWVFKILPPTSRARLRQTLKSPREGLLELLGATNVSPLRATVVDPSDQLSPIQPIVPPSPPKPAQVLAPSDGREVGVISRDDVVDRLDWGSEFFSADQFQVTEHPAYQLLNGRRFDLLAKTIFADYILRGVRSDYGERLYAEHIRVWNGFHEELPPKHSREEFISAFRALIQSLSRDGFRPEESLIPVGRLGKIIDGAHRVAAAAAANVPVQVVWANVAAHERTVPEYDYRFFAESRSHVATGLSPYYMDEMALHYTRLRSTARLVVLFPSADRRFDERTLDVLREVGHVVYQKSLVLKSSGALQLIRHLYHFDPRGWMGTSRNGFAGARDKAERCFPVVGPCRIILFEPLPGADLVDVKARIRKLHGLGNDSIHITDNPEELPLVAGFAFNRNSVEFFNQARPRLLPRFERLFHEYDKLVAKKSVSRFDIAIHGSGTLAAAGLRDCMDIDFVGFGDTSIRAPGINRRAADEHLSEQEIHAIIFDPGQHFWYWGHKFVALKTLREFKIRRGEVPKDVRDIELIDQLLRPSRWDTAVSGYYALVGLQSRGPRDLLRAALLRVGLLDAIRRIRR